MLYWVIQIIVVSVIFILVVHNIFNFLKTTLTVPKAKDLVDVHMEKYKHIYATLKKDDDLSGMINSTCILKYARSIKGHLFGLKRCIKFHLI